jgi:hypothetical protein
MRYGLQLTHHQNAMSTVSDPPERTTKVTILFSLFYFYF